MKEFKFGFNYDKVMKASNDDLRLIHSTDKKLEIITRIFALMRANDYIFSKWLYGYLEFEDIPKQKLLDNDIDNEDFTSCMNKFEFYKEEKEAIELFRKSLIKICTTDFYKALSEDDEYAVAIINISKKILSFK